MVIRRLLLTCLVCFCALPNVGASSIIAVRSGAGSQDMVVEYTCGTLFPEAMTYAGRMDTQRRNGTTAKILIPALSPGSVKAIAVDRFGKMFIGQSSGTGALDQYSNVDGSGKIMLDSGRRVGTIRLTPTDIVFSTVDGTPAIYRRPIIGGTLTLLWAASTTTEIIMDLDITTNTVYWMDDRTVYSMPISGGAVTPTNLTTQTSSTCTFGCSMVVVPSHGFIYYTSGTFGYLHRMYLNGTGQTNLADVESPWYTAGGGAFDPFFPDGIIAMRYDSVDDLVYFASSDYLLAGPAGAASADEFWAKMTVKLDLRYTDITDFELGWKITGRGESPCRVPCDQPNNRCAPNGMCRNHPMDPNATSCICPVDPPPAAPRNYWGPHCSLITDPCSPDAVTWDNQPLCGSPRWRVTCPTDNSGNKTFACLCPLQAEEYVWKADANTGICTCPAKSPTYVNVPGRVSGCGNCTGAGCVCSDSNPATVVDPVLAACGCTNASDCKATICDYGAAAPSQACKDALTKLRQCYPNLASPTATQLLLAHTLMGCDVKWFTIPAPGSGPLGMSEAAHLVPSVLVLLAWIGAALA